MSPRAQSLLVIAGLFAATFLAYWPALGAEFVWNDRDYVTAPELRSASGLARIWFEVGATEQYYPVLHSAFWVQHQLWGDHPAGYHVANVLLHAGCAALFFAILRRLAVPGASLAAFVFALHPVCVESVAWISEQKNTLSLLFYLVAGSLYLRFDSDRKPRAYGAATAAFAVALVSKSVTATLPAALLVVFWWRRGRLEWHRDLRPLVPWFLLAAAMGLFSAWVERKYIGAEGSEFALTGLQRGLLAGRIAWFYAAKLLWPANLAFIYPRWDVNPAEAWQWLFSLGVLGLLGGLGALRHRSRAPLAAALCFGGSLFPVLGFFNVYAFLFSFVADHWQYLPSLGPIALAAASLTALLAGRGPWLRFGVPVVLVTGLGLLSRSQARMYSDARTFYAAVVARNPSAWMGHHNLGNLRREEGRLPEAVAHFETALRLNPNLAKAHYTLAVCLRELKRRDEALPHLRRAVELQPNYTDALHAYGSLLRELGRPGEAVAPLLQAVQLEAEFADARNQLGMALRELGRLPEALAQFERALRIAPASAPVRLNLAITLSLVGRNAEAEAHYREARRLNPALPDLKF